MLNQSSRCLSTSAGQADSPRGALSSSDYSSNLRLLSCPHHLSREFSYFFLFIIFFSQSSAISNSYPSSGFTSLSLACLTPIFSFAFISSAYSVIPQQLKSVCSSDFCLRLAFSLHASSQHFIMHFYTIARCENTI